MIALRSLVVTAILLPIATVIAGAGDNSENWVLTVVGDSSAYATVASLQQESLTTIKDEYAKKDLNPQLQFRCTSGKPEITARIDWQRFISSFSTELGFKVDGGKFTWLKWKVDQSNEVTLSPSADDSQKLITLALSGNRLLVEVTPYSGAPVTVEYDLAEFSGALAKLRNRCSQ